MPLFHFTGENTKVKRRKSLLQSHYSAGKWQSWGLNPGSTVTPESVFLSILL